VNRWLRQYRSHYLLQNSAGDAIALALLRGNLITTLVCFSWQPSLTRGWLSRSAIRLEDRPRGILDPAADKLLLATVFIVLAVLHWVPGWLMAAAVRVTPSSYLGPPHFGCASVHCGASQRHQPAEHAVQALYI